MLWGVREVKIRRDSAAVLELEAMADTVLMDFEFEKVEEDITSKVRGMS